jgi:hypothetical protein
MKPILLALLATLVLTAPASAAVRHAAPTGAGTECTSAQPCSLKTALTGAVKHDEVVLAAGEFAGGAQSFSIAVDIALRGAPGGGTRITFANGGDLSLYGPATQVRDLRVAGESNDLDGLFGLVNGGVAERVEVRATGTNATACFARSAVFTSVLCAASGQGARAFSAWENNGITKKAATTLRNSTFVARGTGSRGLDVTSVDGTVTTLQLHNTIALAMGTYLGLATDSMGGSAFALMTAHSN